MTGTADAEARPVIGRYAGRVLAFVGVDVARVYTQFEKVHCLLVAAAVVIGPLTTAMLAVYALAVVFEVPLFATGVVAGVVFVVYGWLELGVASTPTPKRILDRLKVGGLRLMLVAVVSFLSGEFVAEQYFHTEVGAQVYELRSSQLADVADRIRTTADENTQAENLRADRSATLTALDGLKADVAVAQARVDEMQKLVDAERDGALGGRQPGRGPEFARKLDELARTTAARDEAASRLAAETARRQESAKAIDAEIDALEARVSSRVSTALTDVRSKPASPAERFVALNRITIGDGNWERLPIRLAITFGLFLLEAAAVILKLSRQSRHDAELLRIGEVEQAEELWALEKRHLVIQDERAAAKQERNRKRVFEAIDAKAMRGAEPQLVKIAARDIVNTEKLNGVLRLNRLLGDVKARLGLYTAVTEGINTEEDMA